MTDDDQTDNPNILSSAFFEPSIIKSFLRITLADERFPALAIHYLMQSDDGDDDQKEVKDRLNALRNAANDQKTSPFYLKSEPKIALKDAIQALCTFLALPDSAQTMMESNQQRIMLGFCRILNNQPIEGLFEFDIVRKSLYSKVNKRTKEGKNARESCLEEEEEYRKALWGAELAAGLMGKESEAERYRKWRQTIKSKASSTEQIL